MTKKKKPRKIGRKNLTANALLVRTKEGIEYMVRANLLHQLCEMANALSLEIYEITTEAPDSQIFELKELAEAMCSRDHKLGGIYQLGEKLLPSEKTIIHPITFRPKSSLTRDQIRERARQIREYIAEHLKKGATISIDDVYAKYEGQEDMSRAVIASHFRYVRNALSAEGITIDRVSPSTYRRRIPIAIPNFQTASMYYSTEINPCWEVGTLVRETADGGLTTTSSQEPVVVVSAPHEERRQQYYRYTGNL